MALPSYGARPGLRKLDLGIRKVASTFGRPAFHTHAAKSIGGLVVESASERLISQLLGLDPAVRSFQAQPFTVDLLEGALLHTANEKAQARKRDKVRGVRSSVYTPDFLVRWSLGASTAIEVKLGDWEGDSAYEGKLTRAREVLLQHHIDFVRLTVPSNWRHPLLTTIPLLHQAAMRADLRPDAAMMEQIQMLADGGAKTLGDFCSGLQTDTRMAPVLIVFGALSVDLPRHVLKSSTPAEPAYGLLEHLSLMQALRQ